MKQIIVICPSRGRPKMLGEMIQSFLKTSKISMLTIGLDSDDPYLHEYMRILKDQDSSIQFIVLKPRTTTQIINEIAFLPSEAKFLSVTNDDFIYHTDGWDVILTEEIKSRGKVGIAYGNDLLQNQNMPTTNVISSEIIKTLGWLQLPTLTHLYGDSVWGYLGRQAECLYHRPDVIIEHKHYFSKKVLKDETFLRTNSTEMYNRDHEAFADWVANQSKSDIEKIKELFNG